MLTCTRMRAGVLISALLFAGGFLLEAIAQITRLGVPTSYLALFLVLAAPTILGLTFLVSLLPGTAERLKECRH